MKRILIIEPDLKGHKAFYLAMILRALQDDFEITFLGAPWNATLEQQLESQQVDAVGIQHIQNTGSTGTELWSQAKALCKQQSIDHIFIPYIDSLLTTVLASSEAVCPTSGIWFHPHALDRKYFWLPPIDKRLRSRVAIHHKLRSANSCRKIANLFFLAPDSKDRCLQVNSGIGAHHLPDPPEGSPSLDQAEARTMFNLSPNRVVFLHAGTSDKRKGLSDTLLEFSKLANDPELKERVLLLRVGSNDLLTAAEKNQLNALEQCGAAKVIDGHVDTADFLNCFAAADWVLLPYRKFRFSSGILANAQAANRRVIASNYGSIGAMVGEDKLGLLYKHGDPTDYLSKLRDAAQSNDQAGPILPHADPSQNEFMARIRNAISDERQHKPQASQ